jgi:hypothetical protein
MGYFSILMRLLSPAGTILAGQVEAVQRVGLGIVHETSAIALEFNVTLPDSTVYPISARVIEVDNARERVGLRFASEQFLLAEL